MALAAAEKRRRRNAYMREYYRKWRAAHGGMSCTVAWRRANPDAAEAHRDRERQRWYSDPALRERRKVTRKRESDRTKQQVFDAYGGNRCKCCGEMEVRFLTIDHVNNNGAAERRRLGSAGSGRPFYRYLKRAGFPAGYQVLCANCNHGKRMNGGVCPHANGDVA